MKFVIVIGLFLHDLNNEEENECFIAAVDLEAVNVTDKVDNVTVDKAYQSTEVNKQEVGRNTRPSARVSPYPYFALLPLPACTSIGIVSFSALVQLLYS